MTATFAVHAAMVPCERKWGSKRITKECMKIFWDEVGVGHQSGVYVFGVKAAKGFRPLYVGQTKARTFRQRLADHVRSGKFNSMLKGTRKGHPFLVLVGRVGRGRRSNGAIDDLELDLINRAFSKNRNLHNDRRIKRPTFVIRGFGKGRRSNGARVLTRMTGYKMS